MNHKRLFVGTSLTVLALAVIASRGAVSQTSMKPPFVQRQTTSPGTAESGNTNIIGTAMAGQFKGGGAGLTNLNGTNITSGTIDDERLSPNIANRAEPNVFAVGPNSFFNGDGSDGTMAFYAETLSPVGATVTGKIINNSPTGTALLVKNQALTGTTAAATFDSDSGQGIGAIARGGLRGLSGFGLGSNSVGVYGSSSSIGLLGESTAGKAVVGQALGTSGGNYGGYFSTASSDGIGLYAEATAASGLNYAGRFISTSPSGYAVYGSNLTSGTGGFFKSASGTALTATSTNGTGLTVSGKTKGIEAFAGGQNATTIYGEANGFSGTAVWGRTWASGGRGVIGEAMNSVNAYGGYFVTNSDSTAGVYGEALQTSGTASGGSFVASSPTGFGMTATNVNGTAAKFTSTNGIGVESQTVNGNFAVRGENFSTSWYAVYGKSSSITGTGVGVLGQSESPNGWGLYAFGRSGGTGTKLFRIDHPLDPENKYLNHYSSESPEPINFYSGTVVTDNRGEAWVTLPDYFSSINKDFRYTLTVVDDTDSDSFVMVKVAKKIQRNRFKIRSSVGNTEVSWRVDARRNDLWVQRYGAPETTEKPDWAKGTYQHPELYGKPKEFAETSQTRARVARSPRP